MAYGLKASRCHPLNTYVQLKLVEGPTLHRLRSLPIYHVSPDCLSVTKPARTRNLSMLIEVISGSVLSITTPSEQTGVDFSKALLYAITVA